MLQETVELSIVIVNWNSRDLLCDCLRSIVSASLQEDSYEVLVIDNASFDGSDEMLSEKFPSVIFIQSERNLGFAGGNNLAFQQSKGEYVLFLNPDTEVVGDAIGKMLDVMKSHDDAGVIGPRLVNPDLSVQLSCMRAFPTIFNQLVDSSFSRKSLGRFNFAGVGPIVTERDVPVGVEMLPGTCMLLRRDVFQELGGFSDKYFMYAEDIELNYRVRSMGRTNYYVGKALVVHHGGRSSEQQSVSCFSTVMMKESVWQFLRSVHGNWYGAFYRLTTCLAAVARVSLLFYLRLFSFDPKRTARIARSSRKWAKVFSWCVGRETWARGYKPISQQRPSAAA